MSVQITDIKVGDQIGRQATENGSIIWLTVTKVDDEIIYCNRWMFDRATGAEIDHDLQWGPQYGKTGSYIARVQQVAA